MKQNNIIFSNPVTFVIAFANAIAGFRLIRYKSSFVRPMGQSLRFLSGKRRTFRINPFSQVKIFLKDFFKVFCIICVSHNSPLIFSNNYAGVLTAKSKSVGHSGCYIFCMVLSNNLNVTFRVNFHRSLW